LTEYSVTTRRHGEVPRAGNDSGGGQLGNAIHCSRTVRTTGCTSSCRSRVEGLANRIGGEALVKDPRFAKIAERRKEPE